MSNSFNLCDCSSNGLPLYQPARCMACMSDCSGCGGLSSNINLKMTEKRIQNQVRVPESQYTDVLAATTIAENYLNTAANPSHATTVWANRFNLRNQSDRREPSRTGSTIPKNAAGSTNYVNVPTRGNSTRSTITANKPGAMTPGGYGVDVKHGSYARYLGKLKGRTMAVPYDSGNEIVYTVQPKTVVNNKSYRFNLLNRNCLCNGLSGALGNNKGIYQ